MTVDPPLRGMMPSASPGNPTHPEKDDPKAMIANSAQRMIQFCTLLSELIVLIVGGAVAVMSFMAGVEIWMAVLRSTVAMISVGLILWFVNFMIARQVLEIAMNRLKDEFERDQADQPVSTYERSA